MSHLVFEDVSKHYGSFAAVDGVSLALAEGEFFALVGPSGSGKTTLLRLVAGFTEPTQGRILLAGREVQGLPPHRRDVGMVFQSYALFPHLTVRENVAFGLEARHVPKGEVGPRVGEALALVQMAGLEGRYPHQLSGGQQQRVALARALVIRPRVFLLDEPLGALDRKLRAQMQVELRQLQRAVGVTTLLVTHDQEEALSLADRIGVLNAGRIEQVGAPQAVYERPASRFVADFLGQANFFDGTVVGLDGDMATVQLAGGRQLSGRAHPALAVGAAATLMVRPERVGVMKATTRHEAAGAATNAMMGQIVRCLYAGALVTFVVRLEGDGTATAVLANDELDGAAREGDAVRLSWDAPEAWAMPA